jgi:CoA:oxalate CoA-transferase
MGITLNLRSEKGKKIFQRLVGKVDVVVESFTPGVMANLGLGYEELKKVNPKLIFASISGFGHGGPYRSRTAYDLIVQAMGGMMSVTGYPDHPPVKAGGATGDIISALYGAIAILAALRHRERTGEGQAIDISMQDCIWSVASIEFAPSYFLNGNVPPRTGNCPPGLAPYNIYRAQDGYVVIGTLTEKQWQNLLKTMGREELMAEPRFSTLKGRYENVEEVDAIVQEWVGGKTVAEVLGELETLRIPCAPVLDVGQVASDPQILSREMVVELEHPGIGKLKVPGSVFKLSITPGKVENPAPLLGQHNEEIYSGFLGYSKEQIAGLAAEGAI